MNEDTRRNQRCRKRLSALKSAAKAESQIAALEDDSPAMAIVRTGFAALRTLIECDQQELVELKQQCRMLQARLPQPRGATFKAELVRAQDRAKIDKGRVLDAYSDYMKNRPMNARHPLADDAFAKLFAPELKLGVSTIRKYLAEFFEQGGAELNDFRQRAERGNEKLSASDRLTLDRLGSEEK